jgi:hypothetical protein
MHLKEIGRKNVDWMNISRGRENWWALVNTVMNLIFYTLHSMQYDTMVTM